MIEFATSCMKKTGRRMRLKRWFLLSLDLEYLRVFNDTTIYRKEIKFKVEYMDLRAFYFENIKSDEYHYRFHDAIRDVNKVYNLFTGYEESNDYSFEIFDAEEAILKFRELCQPEVNFSNNENSCWFYLTTYYLYKTGYEIKEFPRILARPPKDPSDFTYGEIRNRIISQGGADNGTVRYATRRAFIADLHFNLKSNHIEISDSINQKFMEISNRQSLFTNMSTDEKLAEIANLIENMLKKNGKFLTIDYSTVCFDYVTEDIVKNYRHKLQCFRHSSDESIKEANCKTCCSKS